MTIVNTSFSTGKKKMPSKAPDSEADTLSGVLDAEARPQRRHRY